MTQPAQNLQLAMERAASTIEGIGPDQWTMATHCQGWTVTDLVGHLRGSFEMYASAFADGPPTEPVAAQGRADADALRHLAHRVMASASAPDFPNRQVTVPFGTVPGSMAIQLAATEALIHGWDLARATAQPYPVPEQAAAGALAFSEQAVLMLPPDQSSFGPPQPVDLAAPAIDRLAALLGRTV